jgi:hypothetical protein
MQFIARFIFDIFFLLLGRIVHSFRSKESQQRIEDEYGPYEYFGPVKKFILQVCAVFMMLASLAMLICGIGMGVRAVYHHFV